MNKKQLHELIDELPDNVDLSVREARTLNNVIVSIIIQNNSDSDI